MSIRLVALDIDRTLLTDDRRVTEANLAALRGCVEKGVHLALCSGRDLPSTLAISEPIGLPFWLVIQNGSLGVTPEGEAFHTTSLPLAAAHKVLDVLERHRLCPVVYEMFPRAYHFWWQEGAQAAPGMLEFRTSHGGVAEIVKDIRPAIPGDVSHLEVYDEADRVMAAVVELEQNPDVVAISNLSASRPGNALMGIYPAGTSKEGTLERLVTTLGFTSHEVLAVGDNLNDVGMVRWAGTGVMVANGPAEALAAADWIAPTNNDSGVATAIERFVG